MQPPRRLAILAERPHCCGHGRQTADVAFERRPFGFVLQARHKLPAVALDVGEGGYLFGDFRTPPIVVALPKRRAKF